uniref:FAST kinase leucine-rich domain-containing protein n=1 Tax=Amblyomma maculatum TaxID=34609 RepID=G3MSZ6_AMBMU
MITSIAFTRRLLCRLPSCVPKTSYSRALSQAKNLVDDAKTSSPPLSYKDYVLEPAGVPQDEFKKRFQACRSVDEVLHLVFSGEETKPAKPQDLVASAEALARIQYRILSSFQWAYGDSSVAIRVQSSVNSDTVDMFTALHHHQSFVDLLNEIDRNIESFTPEETVNLLDTLLKLCMSKNHDVLVKLQQRCITDCQALDLTALARLAEASNFLKRSGFVVSGLVCSLVQQIFDSVPFSVDSYKQAATVLCHVGYFFSDEYLDFVLEKTASMLSSFRGDISPSDSLLFLEAGVRFSSREPRRLQPFLDHCLQSSAKLSVNEMSKLLRLCRLGRLETPSLFDKARELAMLRRSEGLLRTAEVVSLVSILDSVGWSDDLREEFTGLLAIHMPDMDVLLLKHLASSKFLRECKSRDLMNLFAKRWIERLPDVFGSISVLTALIQLYNKTSMIPKYARERLEVQ